MCSSLDGLRFSSSWPGHLKEEWMAAIPKVLSISSSYKDKTKLSFPAFRKSSLLSHLVNNLLIPDTDSGRQLYLQFLIRNLTRQPTIHGGYLSLVSHLPSLSVHTHTPGSTWLWLSFSTSFQVWLLPSFHPQQQTPG